MSENHLNDTVREDDLADEALDRCGGIVGKSRFSVLTGVSSAIAPAD